MPRSAYQQIVADFVSEHDLEAPVPERVLDLVSEVGEVAKEALEANAYGRIAFRPTAGWTGEVGDVFFALICLANSTDVDLEAALREAMRRMAARIEGSGSAGSQG